MNPSEPRVSVVMATRNRARRLARALDALAAQDLAEPFEVVVVDDASDDDTAALLAERAAADGLRVERRASPGGPPGARNSGWRAARGPLVAFTDDDCEPTPRWLSAIVRAADGNPGAFVQGPTRPHPGEVDRLGPFSRTLDVPALGPWFPACNIAYPRGLLEKLGGFDEGLPRGEDTDLAWRAQAAGAAPVWAPEALVYHAVIELGSIGTLRLAAAWHPAVRVLASHPRLRSHLVGGVFWRRSHATLLLATLGLMITRRRRAGVLLVLPYLNDLREATGSRVASARWAPFQVLHDLTEMAALARGSLDARTLVL